MTRNLNNLKSNCNPDFVLNIIPSLPLTLKLLCWGQLQMYYYIVSHYTVSGLAADQHSLILLQSVLAVMTRSGCAFDYCDDPSLISLKLLQVCSIISLMMASVQHCFSICAGQ